MENIDEKAPVKPSNPEDEVLPPKKPVRLPMRPSNAATHVRTAEVGSCMPPSIKGNPVPIPDASSLPSSLPPVAEGLDLSGEAEEYTTGEDGSRSLLDVLIEEDTVIIKKTMEKRDEQIRNASLADAREKYEEYLTATKESNYFVATRRSRARRALIISGVISIALIIALVVLGGI